jgi:hypothetical protein
MASIGEEEEDIKRKLNKGEMSMFFSLLLSP